MFEVPRQIEPSAAGTVRTGFIPPAAIDLRRIRFALWQGKATILCATLAALVLVVLFILVAPQKYTASTQILIDPTDLRAVANELTPASQVSDAALLLVESQVRVLTSDNVLRRVVTAEGLDRDPEFARGLTPLRLFANEILSRLGLGSTLVTADPTLSALNELKRHIQVKRAERTYVVDVSVTSKDPAKAARIANAVTAAYLTEQTQVRSDAARQVSQSLTARLNELKNRVREAEERVEAFKARNNIIGANGQLVSEQQLSDMNNQLSSARARAADAKARLDQIEVVQKTKGVTGAFPSAVQSPTITALRSQYAEIMRREAEQMTTLGALHPAVIEIQAQADRLQRMIADEVNRIALSARTEYESAKANEDTISRDLDTLKHNAITTNEAMVGLRELERDVQASRAVYESFLVRARETGEQERLDTKNVHVISRADLPQRRSSPPSSLLLLLAALLLGVGAGSAIVLLRSPPDAGPQDGSPRPRRTGPFRDRPEQAAAAPRSANSPAVPVLAVLQGLNDVSPDADDAEESASQFAEEIRKVHDTVRGNHDKRRNPSILVACFEDAEDTAAVALTFAAIAAATQKVLLIDADLQRRTLSAIDADQGETGLADVAVGRRQLSDVIVRDRETNINLTSFVASKSRRTRPINDADVKRAFDETRRFDMVVVAAMDVSRDPSARFFAALVDHIVVVASADEADDAAVDQFIARLGLDARKVRGAVLTGAKAA